jgi:predicted dehydrogenase
MYMKINLTLLATRLPVVPLSLVVGCYRSEMQKFKVAFLGGSIDSAIGRTHQVACQMDHRFELVAGAFSTDEHRAKETAERWCVKPSRSYASWRELIASEKERVDAFVVLTPIPVHTEMVMELLAVGAHVICEKALAGTTYEIENIISALGSTNQERWLRTTYNYTGYPMLREIRSWVLEGRFGNVHRVDVQMPQESFIRLGADGSTPDPQEWRKVDGRVPTVALDLGTHLVNLIRFSTGEIIESVAAVSSEVGCIKGVVDDVSVLGRLGGGGLATMQYGKVSLGRSNGMKINIFGSEGAVEWVQEFPEFLNVADKFGSNRTVHRNSPEIRVANKKRYERFKYGHPAGFVEAFANHYWDLADDLSARLEGCPVLGNEYTFTASDALMDLKILEGITEASLSSKWITV